VYDLPKHEKQYAEFQHELHRIGEDIIERLEYVPASMIVIIQAFQKHACKNRCKIITAEKPMAPIEKGLPVLVYWHPWG
jgi:transposase